VKVCSSAIAFAFRLRQWEAILPEGEVKPFFARREEAQAGELPCMQTNSRKFCGAG